MENGRSTTTTTTSGSNDHDPVRRANSLPQEPEQILPLPPGHRRSLSGGLLNRIPFFRSASEDKFSPLSGQSSVSQHDLPQRDNAMASAIRQTKTRKRKGSLRKTALLGTGKLRLERRAENVEGYGGEELEKSPPMRHAGEFYRSLHNGSEDSEGTTSSASQRFGYDSNYDSTITQLDLPSSALTIDTAADGEKSPSGPSPPSTLTSPVTSPISHYASTTDDDEGLTFSAPNVTSAADMTRRRSARSAQLQTNSLVHAPPSKNREHDYSDTEWWGWIILIATWIIFVVGMGSCLGVWSWAWDVGETPYAPPELEDDPTLPIVGYYPALIILTAVMAWVWVVVAWVGMKYFRHARFVDGVDG
jgi:hypothetical protein